MTQIDNTSLPIPLTGIGSRIGLVADKYRSRTEAAAAAGVSVISLRRYIAEEQAPSFQVLARLAIPQGVSLEWIATGEGPMSMGEPSSEATPTSVAQPAVCMDTLGNPVNLDDFVFIPWYKEKASAGHGAAISDQKPAFCMSFRRPWVKDYLRIDAKNLAVLSVKGDSMEGVLNSGDVILVNRADTSPTSGLYVLRIDGDLIVKRVQKMLGGRLEIISANDAYKSFEVDPGHPNGDFAVIGRVVWFGRQL